MSDIENTKQYIVIRKEFIPSSQKTEQKIIGRRASYISTLKLYESLKAMNTNGNIDYRTEESQ